MTDSDNWVHAKRGQQPEFPCPAPNTMLDDIADIAAKALRCPLAIVSLAGPPGREYALYGVAAMQDDPWVVQNIAVDFRTLVNPLVAGESGLRFHAGIPLRGADGYSLGTLAVMDREPRTISESELTILKKLAGLAVRLLDARLQLRTVSRAKALPLTSAA